MITTETVSVYYDPPRRSSRGSVRECWCVTVFGGGFASTTRHATREDADEHAARLVGAKSS